jgi:hypothetical protein
MDTCKIHFIGDKIAYSALYGKQSLLHAVQNARQFMTMGDQQHESQ